MTDLLPPPVRLRPDRTAPLEALLAAPGPHVEPLLDVGRATNGDLLLVLPAPAARLPALLQVPGWPSAGEAVTVLVPLAEALDRLHAAGVAHGGVAADAVAFDVDGAPYWVHPAAPVVRRRTDGSGFADAVAADVRAFVALCGALLGRVGVPVPDREDLPGLADALFAVATAEPVRLHPAPLVEPVAGPPSRLLPVQPGPDAAPAAGLRDRVVKALRPVRLRVWVAAGAVAALLAVVPVLLPSGRSEAPPVRPTVTSRPAAAPARIPTVRPTVAAGEAVRTLVVARARCLAAGNERCLAGVDAAGSPVLEADLDAVRSGADPVRIDPARLAVRTASGGTVLADAGGTTVLAVREPDGWRLRDVAPPPR